ncbi:hypothetical protein A2U01_0040320, partial [Trifolium medium]|nr:hypothetical protein [Trifolium medium]
MEEKMLLTAMALLRVRGPGLDMVSQGEDDSEVILGLCGGKGTSKNVSTPTLKSIFER